MVKAARVYVHRQGWTAMAVALLLMLAAPGGAAAVLYPTQQIDGPDTNIIELGGTALAEDGTGGVVYLRREGSRAHVFAARFVDGAWTAPQRVDRPGPFGTQAFDSSWPRIGAGQGGRLVVTWVQEFGEGSDRLFSASLDPGASRFQDPVPIDLNVGEATATFPSLEMNQSGQAYLSYRIVNRGGSLPPDFVNSDTKLARYNGATWSVLGSFADRNPSTPTRTPTELNSPEVAIDVTGNGMVAFQEPDDEFIDRIYARRLFGTSQGVSLLVSPQVFGDGCYAPPDPEKPDDPPAFADPRPPTCKPVRAPADQFSLDMAGIGQAAVAFRQQPGSGSAVGGTRIMVSTIPDANSVLAGRFRPARTADGTPTGLPGPTTVAVTPLGTFLAAFGRENATFLGRGEDFLLSDPAAQLEEPERVDDGTSTTAPDPVVETAENGAGVTAWKAQADGRGSVSIRERRIDGTFVLGSAAATSGGPVVQLVSSGSGLGDTMVAFRQGGQGFPQIAAAVVDVPPDEQFAVLVPDGFQRSETYAVQWDRAPDALGGVRYDLMVDGRVVLGDLTQRSALLTAKQLGDGVHEIQVMAKDRSGQTSLSLAVEALVDRTAPRARVTAAKRRAIRVVVSDGPSSRAAGVVPGRTAISFGDGKRAQRVASVVHRYAKAGTYRVVVRTRDAAGNGATRTMRTRVK